MNQAAILGVCLLSLGRVDAQASPPSPTGANLPAAQSTQPSNGTAKSSGQTKPSAHHRKKPASPDCNSAAGAPNTPHGTSAQSASQDAPGTKAPPQGAASKPSESTNPAQEKAAEQQKPCPASKKVVRNGGSGEPAIQLAGSSTAEQAAQQRSIDQLTAKTEANLKKTEGRNLNSSQQEMVNQIKQFLEQSKVAAASGNFELADHLAQKAELLSEELVKP